MAIRSLIFVGLLAVVAACRYDYDITGLVYTPVPVSERFEQSVKWSEAQPEREVYIEGSSYKVLVCSDSHLGPTLNLNRFIEIGREEGSAALVIAGDACTGKEEDYEVLVAELESADTIPLFLTPGNHDLYFGGWNSFYSNFGAATYTFSIHASDTSDLYIVLDTGGGTLGTLQMDWLKALLNEQRDNYRHVVVITHVNFIRNRFTLSTNPLNEELLVLFDLFAQHKVGIVIQGHDHIRYVEVFGHTTYLTLDALKDENRNASYLELGVNSDSLSFNFKMLN